MQDMELDDKALTRYRLRKFSLTALTILLAAGLAYFGKMTADVALVFTGAISTFNYALRNSG